MTIYITALGSLVSLAFLVVGLFWIYRDYRIDVFRQQMFSLRDEMFDAAAAGLIPFNHKSYGMLRVTMNGYIRFAHLFNLGYFLLASTPERSSSDIHKSFSEELRDMAQDLRPEQQEMLKEFRIRMSLLVLRHIILSSPLLLMTVAAPLICLLALKSVLEHLLKWFRKQIEEISEVAFVAGNDGSMLESPHQLNAGVSTVH